MEIQFGKNFSTPLGTEPLEQCASEPPTAVVRVVARGFRADSKLIVARHVI